MAFSVRLYEFSKKENSTARPSGTGTEYDCILVRGSGVLQPIIELKLALTTDPAAYNYAYIPAFERYYYISEWTFEGALWRARMTVDALATWKGTIGGQSFYILRASGAKDGSIIDTMYPVKDTFSIAIKAGSNEWFDPGEGSYLASGYFVVGLLSYADTSSIIGGVNYYAFTPAWYRNFINALFSETGQYSNAVKNVFDPISNYSDAQKSNLLYVCENPFDDYIKSVTWVPDIPSGATGASSLYLGKVHLTGVNHYVLNFRAAKRYTDTIELSKHPLTNARGSYVNCAPYTEYFLRLPKVGMIPIDASYFASKNYLSVTLDVDPVTGEGLFRILVSDSSGLINAMEIDRFYAPIGVSIALAQGKELGTRAGAIGQLVSAAVNAITSPGSIAQLPAAIANVQRAEKSAGATLGNNGGWLGLSGTNGRPYLIQVFRDIAADDNGHNGRPLCQVRTPSSLGGYMMVQDADIEAPATSQELAAIKNYMESGFYYE